MSDLAAPPELTILTGASGWFGQAYLAELASGADYQRTGKIRALVAHATEVPSVLRAHPAAEVYVGDINDSDTLKRLLANAAGASLVHAAGIIHPRTVSDFARINIQGTKKLLAEAKKAEVRRMVYLSSNSPFGVNARREDVFRHDEPYQPYLGYGYSKMKAEIAVRQAHGQGIETAVVRPPWFYGEWQPARQTTFFTLCRKGQFPIMGAGLMRRSMAYIGNLVQGVVLAELHPKAAGNAYWVADERPYELAEIVRTVREVLRDEGYAISRSQVRVPEFIGSVAEKVDRLLQKAGRYNQEIHVLGEMNKTIACDISTTVTDLGYCPNVALAEGMRRSIRWCRAQGIEL